MDIFTTESLLFAVIGILVLNGIGFIFCVRCLIIQLDNIWDAISAICIWLSDNEDTDDAEDTDVNLN